MHGQGSEEFFNRPWGPCFGGCLLIQQSPHGSWVCGLQPGEEAIGMFGRDSMGSKGGRREVPQVDCDDRRGAALNCGCQDVAILGITGEGGHEVLIALNEHPLQSKEFLSDLLSSRVTWASVMWPFLLRLWVTSTQICLLR